MRIFVTGDTHGDIDIHKITTKRWPVQKELTKDDFLIIAGDAGIIWTGDLRDNYLIRNYDRRKFTTLFVDGNHENHAALDDLPVTQWHGGNVHRISDSVIHLMRGQVYEIGGKTFFTMGGARSTDKQFRKKNVSWWSREMPSQEEYEEARRNLTKHNWQVDFVITHDCDTGILRCLYQNSEPDELNEFFRELVFGHDLKFREWFFGHHHRDIDFEDPNTMQRYHAMYHRIWEI